MEKVKEFDSFLGGDEEVPSEIFIHKFVSARINEISTLKNMLENPTIHNKLVFQKLPRHMRRRGMSHNPKRLPRKWRTAHLSQQEKSGIPPKQKRPSRKYRRRAKNLQNEYVRRQRRVTWLETHIWHAKRFHMIERWGYKIPDRPCDKAFRACYRASAKHCLLQDVSYISCVELTGLKSELLKGLREISDPSVGLGFGSKAFINGRREGRTILFHPNSYPKQAIGNVTFLWQNSCVENDNSCIWIWAHSSFYAELINVLIEVFSLEEVKDVEMSDLTESETIMNIDKNIEYDSNNKNTMLFTSRTRNKNVQLHILKYELNRFKLTGPLSHTILKHTLKPATEKSILDEIKHIFSDEKNKQIFNIQNNFWENLNVSSPAEISQHLIIGINVIDPRLSQPSKRTKANHLDIVQSHNNLTYDNNLAFSLIWDANYRNFTCKSKIPDAKIFEERSKQIVPGIENSILTKSASIPVLIIQRPGSKERSTAYGSGYDIIIPKSWARPFWYTLILWGARAGGLREERVSILESQNGQIFSPDTKSGKLEDSIVEIELKNKYFGLPPKKRVNYIKLGIKCPFKCFWSLLISEWMSDQNMMHKNEFYVLRDRKKLETLKDFLNGKVINTSIDLSEPCLIPVKLNLKNRGTLKQNAVICLPLENEKIEPIEPIHKDFNKKERCESRRDHKLNLKRLRKKRIKTKQKIQEANPNKIIRITKANTEKLIKDHREKMQELWIPRPDKIRHSCSRETIGFITHGDFSFTEAKTTAVGYIALQSIKCISNGIVLTRNTTSSQYRFANIDIIL